MHYSENGNTELAWSEDEICEAIEHDFWYNFRSQIGWCPVKPYLTIIGWSTSLLAGSGQPIRFMPKELGSGNFFIEVRTSGIYSRRQLVDYLSELTEVIVPIEARDMLLNNQVCVVLDAFYTW